jgi:hypothetical protein
MMINEARVDDVVQIAMLGTRNRAPKALADKAPLPPDIALALDQLLLAGNPEKFLMHTLATLDLATRAGALVLDADPDLALRDLEHDQANKKPPSRAAIVILRQILRQDPISDLDLRYLAIWIHKALQNGWRLPDELTARTIYLLAREKDAHPLLAEILGSKLAWLIDSLDDPEIAGAYREILHRDCDLQQNQMQKLDEGLPAERMKAVHYLHAKDSPEREALRERLKELWPRESLEDRIALANVFSLGVALDDEDFIEQVLLTDKRKEIRKAGQDMLADLDGSRYLARMAERFVSIFDMSGANKFDYAVSDMLAADIQANRDGLIEAPTPYIWGRKISNKENWVYQIAKKVPPSLWLSHFGMTASNLCAALLNRATENILGLALLEAIARYDDRESLSILVDKIIDGTQRLDLMDWAQAMPVLRAIGRHQDLFERLIAGKIPKTESAAPKLDLGSYILACNNDSPWSVDLSQKLMDFIERQLQMPITTLGYSFLEASRTIGFAIDWQCVLKNDMLSGENLQGKNMDSATRKALETMDEIARIKRDISQA